MVVLRVCLPHSCLNCCPCNETSQLVALRLSLSQQLRYASRLVDLLECFRKFFTCAFPQHILGTLREAASFLPWLRNQIVVASSLEFSRLSDDRWQCLLSNFVAQWAATFGVSRNHTNAFATITRSRKGGSQRVHARQYTQRGVTLQNPLYSTGRSIRQVEYHSSLYT